MIFDWSLDNDLCSLKCECCTYLAFEGDTIAKLVNVAMHEWEVHGFMHQ